MMLGIQKKIKRENYKKKYDFEYRILRMEKLLIILEVGFASSIQVFIKVHFNKN